MELVETLLQDPLRAQREGRRWGIPEQACPTSNPREPHLFSRQCSEPANFSLSCPGRRVAVGGSGAPRLTVMTMMMMLSSMSATPADITPSCKATPK